jgi:hypothetical protein
MVGTREQYAIEFAECRAFERDAADLALDTSCAHLVWNASHLQLASVVVEIRERATTTVSSEMADAVADPTALHL